MINNLFLSNNCNGYLGLVICSLFLKKNGELFADSKYCGTFASANENETRAFSSAGSEHLPYKQRVGGSNPSTPTRKNSLFLKALFGRLAQLVQSICLTSRGSAVRIRQRPPQKAISQIFPFGRLAQLVQSICLTSRGSAVRIRQRPPQKRKHTHTSGV